MRQVYLDYSATTPVKEAVLKEMLPYFTENFGNPSTGYKIGQTAREAMNSARRKVADLIGAEGEEVYFTSSGTESDNWAVFGAADAKKEKGNHIITTKTEHHAMLHSCEFLEKRGYEVTYLDVECDGRVNPKALEEAVTDKTILISVIFANNEVGTLQPIKELCEIAKKHNVLFHTDAVQALGNVPIDVKELGIDLMSVTAHKIYGPKGIGALYIKNGVTISNFMHGGEQENKKRAGTENMTGIVGFGKAAELAKNNLEAHIQKITELRNYFIDQITSKISDVAVNGSMEHRHPGNANITFKYIEGESILISLDQKGIAASTGSACSSASQTPSHVLSAMKIPIEDIHGTLRFSFGDFTTKDDLDYAVKELVHIVDRLRSISAVSSKKGW